MKSRWFIALALLAASTFAGAQVPDATPVYGGSGTCFDGTTAYGTQQQVAATCLARACSSGFAQSHGMGAQCGSSGGAGANTNAAMQAAMNQLGTAIDQAVGNELHKMIFGDPAAKAAAEAAAAEAQREQQAAIARQQALEEQRRQAVFQRLSHELMGLSAAPQLQMMGLSNGSQLQMMGMDDAPKLGMMGTDVASSVSSGSPSSGDSTVPAGPQTCFFGECGPQNPDLSEPIEAWNDPKVVDLRDLQQGIDLANVATKAPPAERQTIMDQALAAANGNQSVQVTAPSDNAVPVMNEQGLLAFQQANNAYRQAHESAYQLQQNFQLSQQRQAAVNAVVTQSEQQLEAELKANIDKMTLEQKQLAMAKIFDAALQQELAYGKTWAQYLAARQKYYQDQYDLQMYLWNTALGKQGSPPSPPPQLAQRPVVSPTKEDGALLHAVEAPSDKTAATISGPPDSDLNLVLDLGPVTAPTAKDLDFLEQIDTWPDSFSQKVYSYFRQNEAVLWSKQAAFSCPSNLANQFDRDPQFQQKMNSESKTIYAQQQQVSQGALHDAEAAWNQEISKAQSSGLYQPGIPLDQQVQSKPQLAAQLNAVQKQITAELDYKVTRAQYEAQQQWQKWIEQQEAAYRPPTISAVAAARD
jgi:hypothetical protein